jgi:antitoxin component YwqK of YwqJK toxin-antitoxin module
MKYKGAFKEGQMNGKFSEWYITGDKQATGKYELGVKSGKWTFYDNRGNLYKKQSFVEGKPTGKWSEYYISGKPKAEGSYKGVYKHGIWTYWDANGKVVLKVRYNNGNKEEEIFNAAKAIPKR